MERKLETRAEQALIAIVLGVETLVLCLGLLVFH